MHPAVHTSDAHALFHTNALPAVYQLTDEQKMAIGDPSEKTSVLEPIAYENRYNYYLPYMRTTYYAQKE